ncbi:MAG: YafY family transcriptional regulator [Mycobacterium sp.]|nr:YafY family transcriptional regulator [Mycobacterium sp.]
MTAGPARLVRMLNMVPYFLANPRVSYAKAAADLGVTPKQLRTDVGQLFMCGLPGYGPGDLIDFADSADYIEVTFDAGMDRPLRLTSTEATALLMALNALADIPGVLDQAAARSAIAKIEAAAGGQSGAEPALEHSAAESAAAAAARQAAHDQRALQIEYFSASRDAQSTRVVDPIRVVLVGDQSYLEAWCREAEAVRLFRFDRIVDATVLDERAAPPRPAVEAPTNTALFDADPSLASATLRISPRAAWMLEYFPIRVTTDLPDGWCEAQMTYAAEEWVARQILGFGADAQVLAPDSLARKVRQAATHALAAYAELDG